MLVGLPSLSSSFPCTRKRCAQSGLTLGIYAEVGSNQMAGLHADLCPSRNDPINAKDLIRYQDTQETCILLLHFEQDGRLLYDMIAYSWLALEPEDAYADQ